MVAFLGNCFLGFERAVESVFLSGLTSARCRGHPDGLCSRAHYDELSELG